MRTLFNRTILPLKYSRRHFDHEHCQIFKCTSNSVDVLASGRFKYRQVMSAEEIRFGVSTS